MKQLAGKVAEPYLDNSLGEHGIVQLNGSLPEFDHVFQPSSNQQGVYDEMNAFHTSVGDGYSVCVFAFGHTGPEKAHRMDGTEGDPGANFRALESSFEIAGERNSHYDVSITVSILEIYNDNFRDPIAIDGLAKRVPDLEIRNAVSFFCFTHCRINSMIMQQNMHVSFNL